MDRLLIYSLVLATAFIPLVLARRGRPARSLRRTVVTMTAFTVAWVFSLWVVVPRLL